MLQINKGLGCKLSSHSLEIVLWHYDVILEKMKFQWGIYVYVQRGLFSPAKAFTVELD